MTSYIKKLRNDGRFKESLFVTLIEQQGDFIRASRFAGYFRDKRTGHMPPNVCHMSRDSKGLGRMGVPSTEVEKKRYIRDLNATLARGSIHIMDFPILDGNESGKKEDGIKELKRQLDEFAIKTRPIARPSLGFVKKKITYTGKDTGPDDRAMALQILVYWSQKAIYEDYMLKERMRDYTLCCG